MRTAQMTGEIELPADARLGPRAVARVQVEDASLADAPSRVVGEQRIKRLPDPTAGELAIPFAFSVSIEDERSYLLVRAHVSQQGDREIRPDDYLTVESIPVLTGGHGDRATVPVSHV